MGIWKTVTVASSGGDYTSLNAVDAGEATNLRTANLGDLVVSCENFEDTVACDLSSGAWDTDINNRLIIEAADNHNGKWSTSTYRLVVQNATPLNFSGANLNHVIVRGIQVRHHGSITPLRCIRIRNTVGVGLYEFDKLLLINDTTASGGSPHGFQMDNSDSVIKARNCIIIGNKAAQSSSVGFKSTSSSAAAYLFNCTLDDWDIGVGTATSTVAIRLRNTRITACNNVKTGTANLHGASDYNITDLAAPTNWGAASIDSGDTPTIDYVDDSNATRTNRDLHLNSSSDSGYEVGNDLTSHPDQSFTDDVDGTTRTSPWDMGAHELSSDVEGAIVKVLDEIVRY